MDETFIKVHGRWRYLYRASDRDGNLVDVILSEQRNLAAAKAFLRSAKTATEVVPERVTTDAHDAFLAAVRSELGKAVRHRTNLYLNNHLEQDHRGIKDRYRPMRSFKSLTSASRFCRVSMSFGGFCGSGPVITSMSAPIEGDCVNSAAPSTYSVCLQPPDLILLPDRHTRLLADASSDRTADRCCGCTWRCDYGFCLWA